MAGCPPAPRQHLIEDAWDCIPTYLTSSMICHASLCSQGNTIGFMDFRKHAKRVVEEAAID
eukprot:11225225-Lingulodinium_polyedra.AAC.1